MNLRGVKSYKTGWNLYLDENQLKGGRRGEFIFYFLDLITLKGWRGWIIYIILLIIYFVNNKINFTLTIKINN